MVRGVWYAVCGTRRVVRGVRCAVCSCGCSVHSVSFHVYGVLFKLLVYKYGDRMWYAVCAMWRAFSKLPCIWSMVNSDELSLLGQEFDSQSSQTNDLQS